jgi:SAM-dependent methyltransferase
MAASGGAARPPRVARPAGASPAAPRGLAAARVWAKWLLFPGLDLHTRCRYRFLPRYFRPGPINTLDAGCGNGALAYAAYRLGNRVLGVTYDPGEVCKARRLFSAVGTDPRRLRFEVCNLYDLPRLGLTFDQIICSETLEHIARDDVIIRHFAAALRPGGVLHLCSPYALHPDYALERGISYGPEDGGHVRAGYTLESYAALLRPAGFQIVTSAGLGSPLLLFLDKPVRAVRDRFGPLAALPLFLLSLPLSRLDSLHPDVPYSLYVQAVKR